MAVHHFRNCIIITIIILKHITFASVHRLRRQRPHPHQQQHENLIPGMLVMEWCSKSVETAAFGEYKTNCII